MYLPTNLGLERTTRSGRIGTSGTAGFGTCCTAVYPEDNLLYKNESEFISEKRRSKIFGSIHSSWEKFAHDSYPNTGSSLFGDNFQSIITGKVEKESVALSLSRRVNNMGTAAE